jgi:serine/threonine protein kinase
MFCGAARLSIPPRCRKPLRPRNAFHFRESLIGAGIGLFGMVYHVKGTHLAVKTFPPLEKRQHSERQIYELLRARGQNHPNVLKYYGRVPPEYEIMRGGLLFEYHPRERSWTTSENGMPPVQPRHSWRGPYRISSTLQYCSFLMRVSSWSYQAASALAYIHSLGIIHCDVGMHNFLVHSDGRLVLCDFSGSEVEGLENTVGPCDRYASPYIYDVDYSMRPEDDVFALGTVIYELFHEQKLFDCKRAVRIDENIRDEKFPAAESVPLPFRSVMDKCRRNRRYKAREAMTELGTLDALCY